MKVVQTLVAFIAAPLLWSFAVVCLTIAYVSCLAQALGMIWRTE